jgi:hypothetical protein
MSNSNADSHGEYWRYSMQNLYPDEIDDFILSPRPAIPTFATKPDDMRSVIGRSGSDPSPPLFLELPVWSRSQICP